MKEATSIYRGSTESAVVLRRVGEQPYISAPHLHDSIEIYYNVRGCRSFLLNNCFYRCEPNDMFLIPALQIHKALLNDEKLYERCIISISPEMIHRINTVFGTDASPFRSLLQEGQLISHKTHLNPEEHLTMMRLIEQYNRPESDDVDRLIVLLQILQFVRRKYETDPVVESNFLPETLADRILDYVERNFKNQISVAKIAQDMALSDTQLYRLFKKETGMSIKEYLTIRRIAEAKKLLQLGYSVKETCYQSGFNDYPNFIKAFKKVEKLSPSQLEKLDPPI